MTELPAGWSVRRPVLDDGPEILDLVHASDIAAVGEPDFTAAEVRERLSAPNTDPARDCWLALDPSGAIMGWAYPHNPSGGDRDFIEVYGWPQRGEPALRPLLALVMDRVAERGREFGHEPYTVRAGAVPVELPWIAALTGAGFVLLKQHARMTMTLDRAMTFPEPAPGVTVRPVRPDDEAELRRFHATIAEAFRDSDHPATDYGTWRSRRASGPGVAWDEWFVGEVGGQWAGVLQSAGAGDGGGWVRALAVLRPYRRRGVGAALLHRAFAAYAAKGRSTAGLGVDLANPTQAARLYRAVGMRPLYQADIYQRTV